MAEPAFDPGDLDVADLDAYGELTDEQLAEIFEDLHGPQPDTDSDDEPDSRAIVDVPTWGLL